MAPAVRTTRINTRMDHSSEGSVDVACPPADHTARPHGSSRAEDEGEYLEPGIDCRRQQTLNLHQQGAKQHRDVLDRYRHGGVFRKKSHGRAAAQSAVGGSMPSMTSTSTGPRVASSFSPPCSLTAVITDEPCACGGVA